MTGEVPWEQVLQKLPFAVEIKNMQGKVIFSNEARRNLLIAKRMNDAENGKSHQTNGKEGVAIVWKIPIDEEYYAEILEDIIPPREMTGNNEDLSRMINIAIQRFGKTGSETIVNEKLPFVHDSKEQKVFLDYMTITWFASLGQGEINQDESNVNLGFFGPLPARNCKAYHSFAAQAMIRAEGADERLNGKEIVLILFFIRTEIEHLFADRKEIYEMISRQFSDLKSVADIDSGFLNSLKEQVVSYAERKRKLAKVKTAREIIDAVQ